METVLNLADIPLTDLSEIDKTGFAPSEVFNRVEDIRVRRTNLDKAAVLANNLKFKIRVVYVDKLMLYKKIECHIRSVNNHGILIEGGATVPLHCIYSADIL